MHYLFLRRGETNVGFAMPVIYDGEDGKCFIMEFCVFPEFRGGGTGTEAAKALLRWAKMNGAPYAELNFGGDERRERFWSRLGFVRNGSDEWGEPLMMTPPEEKAEITVAEAAPEDDWHIFKLENGFFAAVGEEPLTDAKKEKLMMAAAEKKIRFFIAKRGFRVVGMCSIAPCFSTFTCGETAEFEDFFIEPVFRGGGTAGKLVSFARMICEKEGIDGLTVGCADCDVGMYRALGFDVKIGSLLAWNK